MESLSVFVYWIIRTIINWYISENELVLWRAESKSVVDLMGAWGTSLGVQIFAISCSLLGNFGKIVCWQPPPPLKSWRTHLGEILDPQLKISHYLMQLRLTYISAIFNLMKFDSYSRFSVFSPCSRFSSFVHIQDSLPLAHIQDSHLLCMFKNFISSCYFLSTRKSFLWEHTISNTLTQGGHVPVEMKFPVFSLCSIIFPCVIFK